MKNLAIIPARGGSKRIPRKNIKPFCGQPIIKYSIDAAIKAGCFDEVMVSTDDSEIADVAMQCGAKVPFYRSSLTSNDYAGLADVVCEVLHSYENLQKRFDNICIILPTAPFITAEVLISGYDKLINQNLNAILSVVKFSYPIQRGLIQKNGFLQMINPDYYNLRSQDIESVYHDAGQFYWIKNAIIMSFHTLFPPKSSYIELSDILSQDIDSVDDWTLAEMKFKFWRGSF